MVEALSPLADLGARQIEALGDLPVAQALGGQQNHLGAHHVSIG
jgi:hypothetical protein